MSVCYDRLWFYLVEVLGDGCVEVEDVKLNKGVVMSRLAGIGVLGVAGVIGGSLLFSQTAFAEGHSGAGDSSSAPSCIDGTTSSSSSTPGSHSNELANPVLICGTTSVKSTTYSAQPITVTFWQTYSGHGVQTTSLNGDIVLDLKDVANSSTTTASIYVPPTRVVGKAHSDYTVVSLSVPSGTHYSEVTGGYFKGIVTSNTKPIELHYQVRGMMGKSGTQCDEFTLMGNAWIDPLPLGSPIAPLFGSDGMEIVGAMGVASALSAAIFLRRRQVARSASSLL